MTSTCGLYIRCLWCCHGDRHILDNMFIASSWQGGGGGRCWGQRSSGPSHSADFHWHFKVICSCLKQETSLNVLCLIYILMQNSQSQVKVIYCQIYCTFSKYSIDDMAGPTVQKEIKLQNKWSRRRRNSCTGRRLLCSGNVAFTEILTKNVPGLGRRQDNSPHSACPGSL